MFIKALILSLILGIYAHSASASDALSVDRLSLGAMELAFPNDNNIVPEISDFRVINSILMSSEAGARWAVLTLVNNASGIRTLNNRHLIGLLADGNRIEPQEFKQSFAANQTMSITLNFGESQFPLLEVYTRLKQ